MNELAIAVAIILFPGLIATVITDNVTVHSTEWSSLKYGIYSFIFGVMCYLALQLLCFTFNLLPDCLNLGIKKSLSVWSLISPAKAIIDLSEVFFASILSPLIALFGAYLVNHKILNRIASHLKISQKYGDENLFSFYLNAKEINWIYVRDFDRKLTYQGMVVSYSETDSMQEIVLSNVTVYGYEDSIEYYQVPSIYLTKPMGSFVIEAVPTQFLE